jgi:hypothetical protein
MVAFAVKYPSCLLKIGVLLFVTHRIDDRPWSQSKSADAYLALTHGALPSVAFLPMNREIHRRAGPAHHTLATTDRRPVTYHHTPDNEIRGLMTCQRTFLVQRFDTYFRLSMFRVINFCPYHNTSTQFGTKWLRDGPKKYLALTASTN